MKSLDQKMQEIGQDRQRRVGLRAAQLIAQEMSLRDLRHALHKTQKAVANKLGMGQDGISRLEKRSDILLSTLRGYVEAIGGSLSLVAEFPDREPVKIAGIRDVIAGREEEKHRRGAGARAGA
jgi:transcriptional regulator with XRE-family HTH domain